MWGLCHPLNVLHHLRHQVSSRPLPIAQLSVLTPLAAGQALFFLINAQGPTPEKYIPFVFLPFCQFSRSGQGRRNKQEFKHRLPGIVLFVTQKLNRATHTACDSSRVPADLACLSGLQRVKRKNTPPQNLGCKKFEFKGSAVGKFWVARGLPISAQVLVLFHITIRNKLSSSDLAPHCDKLKLQYTKSYLRKR